MNPILRFILIFILSYSLLIFCFRLPVFSSLLHGSMRSAVTSMCSVFFSRAHIESQAVYDQNNEIQTDKMFLVFGNPSQINETIAQAKAQGLSEINIPTRSTQFMLFELITVPILFIISLFIATPMENQKKWRNCIFSLMLMCAFLVIKIWVYTAWSISSHSMGIYEYNNEQMNSMGRLISFLSLGFSIMLGLLLWLFLGFSKSNFIKDLQTIFSPNNNNS